MSTADIVVREPNLLGLSYSVTSIHFDGSPPRHGDRTEARTDPDRPAADLLRSQHSGVVDRFIALVRDEVENLFDTSIDQDFTADSCHLNSPLRMGR